MKKLSSMTAAQARSGVKKWLFIIFRMVFLLSVSYIVLFPLFFMVSKSFTPQSQVYDPNVVWLPKSLSLENFRVAVEVLDYWKSLLVTVLVMVVSALIEVLSCALPAYGMARFQFFERGALFVVMLLTILIPTQAYIIPLFLNFRDFDPLGLTGVFRSMTGARIEINLIDTPFVFYLPSLFGVGLRSGLFVFIYRQFFLGLPKELEESAGIDGAGPLKTFIRIVLPSSGVAMLTVAIFSVIWHWNDYYLSVIYFSKNFPLSVALADIESSLKTAGYGVDNSVIVYIMAGCLLVVLPVLVMYLVLQKKFIESVNRVGIVG